MSSESTAEEIAEVVEDPRHGDSGGDEGPTERTSHTRMRSAGSTADGGEWCDPEPEDERRFLVIAHAWRDRYGFSKAETPLFHAALIGMPRAVYAARKGVQPGTIAKQVKSIVDKVRRDGDVQHLSDVVAWALRDAILEESTRCTP